MFGTLNRLGKDGSDKQKLKALYLPGEKRHVLKMF